MYLKLLNGAQNSAYSGDSIFKVHAIKKIFMGYYFLLGSNKDEKKEVNPFPVYQFYVADFAYMFTDRTVIPDVVVRNL